MTDFQYQATMAKRDAAVVQALFFLKAGDTYMFSFWSSVVRAYEARATDCSDSEQQARLLSQIRSVYEVESRWPA